MKIDLNGIWYQSRAPQSARLTNVVTPKYEVRIRSLPQDGVRSTPELTNNAIAPGITSP